MSSIATYLVAGLLVCLYVWAFRLVRSPLHAIPGPFWARISPVWLAYHTRRGQCSQIVHEAHKKYGPIVLISPNHVSLATPEAIDLVYSHGKTMLNKSPYYSVFVSQKPSIFSTLNRGEHSQKRRIVSQAFSLLAIEQFVPLIRTQLHTLVGELSDRVRSGHRDHNLMKWINFLTFDTLSDLAFGETIGMLTSGSDLVDIIRQDGSPGQEHAIALVDGREHLAAVLGLLPAFLRPIVQLIPDQFFRRGRECSSGLTDFAREKVLRRLNSGIRRDDILGKMITAHEKRGNDVRKDKFQELVGECVTLLIAGSDTTAATSSAAIFMILRHPAVHHRLMAELGDNLSKNEVPHYENVKYLPYLHAVILEALRLHSTVSLGLPRSTSENGLSIGKYYIPPNTDVSVPIRTAHHLFFEDGDCFKPERWLDTDIKEKQHLLLGFGKGPRACIGRHLADVQMCLIIATIFMNFDMELLSDHLESKEGFTHKVINFPVRLTPRK